MILSSDKGIFTEEFLQILIENFKSGIRLNSPIAKHKIRRLFDELHPNAQLPADFNIVERLRKLGVVVDDKCFIISEDNKIRLGNLVADIFPYSARIDYDAFFDNHRHELIDMGIASEEILRAVLQKIAPNYHYAEKFFASCEVDWKEHVRQYCSMVPAPPSFEELCEAFPYISPDELSTLTNDVGYCVRDRQGRLTFTDDLLFDEEEIAAAKRRYLSMIKAEGCAVIEPSDFQNNAALNPQLPESVLLNAIFRKFFADTFKRRGKLLTDPNAPKLNVTTLLTNLCRQRRELPFSEMLDYAETLCKSKSVHRLCLEIAYKEMIRVSKDMFVARDAVQFDVAAVDECLSSFVRNKIIPLRAVSSFVTFPPPSSGTWNLFLLESFLLLFSERYKLLNTLNSVNAGAIVPKYMHFDDYLRVQAAAVVQEHVPLDQKSVAEFLIDNGYRYQNRANIILEIIDKARQLARKEG